MPDAVVTIVGVDVKAPTDATGRYSLQVARHLLRAERIQVKVDALGLPSETADVVISGAALTVDMELRLAFTEQVTVGSRASSAESEKAVPVDIFAAGVQNLFNVFPDRNTTVNSFNGIQTFPSHSPFGMNGRGLYARIGRTF